MRKDREEKEKKKRVKMGNNQRPKGRLEWGKRMWKRWGENPKRPIQGLPERRGCVPCSVRHAGTWGRYRVWKSLACFKLPRTTTEENVTLTVYV